MTQAAGPMARVVERILAEDEADIRLDRWFKRHYPGLAHGRLEKLLRTGQVRVDGKRASASQRLAAGQKIRVPPLPEGADEKPAAGPYRPRPDDEAALRAMIIYEDADVIVLNKEPGLAVQGGLGITRHLDGMLAALADRDGNKPKLVHRLDRETSGILLLARTPLAASHFTKAFRIHKVEKIYCAVTVGVPRPARGLIDLPLGKGLHGRMSPEGDDPKTAETRYEIIGEVAGKAAQVALLPRTGRTHQLRAHLSLTGTPILGDPLYGPTPAIPASLAGLKLGKGMHLHAWRIAVAHPRKGRLDLEAPLPDHMRVTFSTFGFSLVDMKHASFYQLL